VEARRDNYESGIYEAAESAADAAEVNSFTFVCQDRASLELGAAEHVQGWANKALRRVHEQRPPRVADDESRRIYME
jgi:hypothetical protein